MPYIGCSKKGTISLLLYNWRRSAKLKSKNEIRDNLHLENATCSVSTYSFQKNRVLHIEFEYVVPKSNQQKRFHFENTITRVFHESRNSAASFAKHLAFGN